MLTGAELVAMRAAQVAALPETCVRARATRTQTAGGSWTNGAASTITLDCRVSPNGVPGEYLRHSVASGRQPVMITLPSGSDVRRTDTLTVAGLTYEIIGLVSAGEWETALRCVCERMT
jgi:hypothetical protein